MGLLRDRDKRLLQSKFETQLGGEVRLVVFTQEFECEYCEELRELSEEVASLSDKIRVNVYDFQSDRELARKWRVDKIPALLIFGGKEHGVRFFGLPSGYEFTTLVEDIIDVSRGTSRLRPDVKEGVRRIRDPVHIQVFVTPTCPYCPLAVRTAHQMAIENENILADMVEVLEFPHLANRYQVMAVPKIVINDVLSFEGAVPEHLFLEYIYAALKG
ncbi:MAG: thioredoxin family protein [Nitrososphaeria archaeon]|nr:thioredoxin family protein [Nitrososphaeria archaeon]